MTPLRQRMTDELLARNYAPGTRTNYLHHLHHIVEFARFLHASPELLDLDAVREY